MCNVLVRVECVLQNKNESDSVVQLDYQFILTFSKILLSFNEI